MRGSLSLRALALASVATALLPQMAHAQDEAGAAEDDSNIIIVTAQGREQSLADVPVAISAVNGETLQNSGASDIRQLNQLSPSLLVSSTSSEAAGGGARIRGIGTVGAAQAFGAGQLHIEQGCREVGLSAHDRSPAHTNSASACCASASKTLNAGT